MRSLGYAREALNRADPNEPRPAWISFYDSAELEALTAIVQEGTGAPTQAEAASQRALAAIPKQFRRNRAMTTVHLGIAQVQHGDAEQACVTVGEAFASMDGAKIPGRMRSLLGDFHRDLLSVAPTAPVTREWADRYRAEWSRDR